ncbi:hypothetical protein EDC04DRAFT_1025391 [Pisolithus marmoratus]|nr:hypothetical protein EDC04DRAFT_1025391 [Pisolithus marmoratus]
MVLCVFQGQGRGSYDAQGLDTTSSNNFIWTYGSAPYVLGYYCCGCKMTLLAITAPRTRSGKPQVHEIIIVNFGAEKGSDSECSVLHKPCAYSPCHGCPPLSYIISSHSLLAFLSDTTFMVSLVSTYRTQHEAMPPPVAVWVVVAVAGVAAVAAFHQFVSEAHIAPAIEAWAEDFVARRRFAQNAGTVPVLTRRRRRRPRSS